MISKQPVALVTGGSGFLGSHFCERLLAEGHQVLCLDNLLTGTFDNVKHLQTNPDFTLLLHDVTSPIHLEQLLVDKNSSVDASHLDYVLHFASPASPKDYATYPIHTLKVGALGTLHTLGVAKAYGAKFLLASSSEVYGDPQVTPQKEEYYGNVNPIGPRSVYDEAKRFGESLSSAYFHTHNLSVRIARIFNTYGSRMRLNDGRAVPSFMTQAIKSDPLTVYGDGLQTRSFSYIDDTVEGLYRLMLYDAENSSDQVTVMNIGNPDEVTVLQVAQEIIELTNSISRIVFHQLPEDDPKIRRPDIGLARRLLGWEPRVSRIEGLKKTASYFQEVVRYPSVS